MLRVCTRTTYLTRTNNFRHFAVTTHVIGYNRLRGESRRNCNIQGAKRKPDRWPATTVSRTKYYLCFYSPEMVAAVTTTKYTIENDLTKKFLAVSVGSRGIGLRSGRHFNGYSSQFPKYSTELTDR